MLRITTLVNADDLVLKLEGRLAGEWVGELEACWQATTRAASTPVLIDLDEVSYVDRAGAALLHRLRRAGARFHARDCVISELVREPEEG